MIRRNEEADGETCLAAESQSGDRSALDLFLYQPGCIPQGVLGQINAITGFTVGTMGVALGTTGAGVGVFGQTFSPVGTGGLFTNVPGGNILVGSVGQPEVNVFRDSTCGVFADGGFQPNGADFAESMAVRGDRTKYAAGDLLVIDPTANRRLALGQQPYSTLVAGIYYTKPGFLGSTCRVDESALKMKFSLQLLASYSARSRR